MAASNAAFQALPRRIKKETERLEKDPPPGITCNPHQSNPRYFLIKLFGPKETPYENGVFSLEMFLPAQYPMEAPSEAGGGGGRQHRPLGAAREAA